MICVPANWSVNTEWVQEENNYNADMTNMEYVTESK